MRYTYENYRLFTDRSVPRRSGRWRSEYILNLKDRNLEGKILVNVHYYEQGNVRHLRSHPGTMVLTVVYLGPIIHVTHRIARATADHLCRERRSICEQDPRPD